MALPSGYLPATRHPWPCLVFILPLLVAYEVGVLALGGANPETVRNGADHWLRYGLNVLGVGLFWVPPAALVLVFVVGATRRWRDRPDDLTGVLSGMVLESVAFALGLWAFSRALAPLLLRAGIALSAGPGAVPAEPGLRQVITYLGAGLYEEA